jgi:hypothetical protein
MNDVTRCPYWEMKPKSLTYHCSKCANNGDPNIGENKIIEIVTTRLESYYDGVLLESVEIEINKLKEELRQQAGEP